MAKKAFFDNLNNVSSKLDEQKKIGGETVKKSVIILPELERLIPPLSNEEYEGLRQSISTEQKVRDPLVVWKRQEGDRVLIDGHHRYKLIKSLNVIDWNIVEMEFNDIQQVKLWMVSNQNSRRNFTPVGMSFLRGNWYLDLRRERGGDNRGSDGGTADAVGELFGVNRSTIHRDAKIAVAINGVTDESIRLILLGKDCPFSKGQMERLGSIAPEKLEEVKSMKDLEKLLGVSKKPAVDLPKAEPTKFERKVNTIFTSLQGKKRLFMANPSMDVINQMRQELDKLEKML